MVVDMELLLLAILGVLLLVVDKVGASAEWVRVLGVVFIVLAGVLFLVGVV